MSIRIAILTVVLVSLSQDLFAQGYRARWYSDRYRDNSQPAYSSTLQEGAQRGRADIIRSQGQYNLDTSAARINNEEARGKYIENSYKWTETYWARKRLGEQEVAKDNAERSRKQAAYREYNRERSDRRQSQRLSPTELEPTAGKISWPLALLDAQYTDTRKQLDELFEIRAKIHYHPQLTKDIEGVAEKMEASLRKNISSHKPNDYLAARKFIEKLKSEARIPVG